MNLKSIVELLKKNEEKIVLIIGGILIAALSFGIGRLTVLNTGQAELVYEKRESQNLCLRAPQESKESSQVAGTETKKEKEAGTKVGKSQGKFVGSKNSNKYHLPSCRWAKKIKEENKIWFQSKEEAEKAGYVPCGTCLK